MYNQEYRFAKGDRVRLKGAVDTSIYGDFACVGNEGIVMDRRKDRFDLPEISVKWDRNHWAYNGAPDCWTFEEHFELVEDNMSEKSDFERLFGTLAKMAKDYLAEEPPASPKKEEPKGDLLGQFLNIVNQMNNSGDDRQGPEDHSDEDVVMGGQVEAAIDKLGNAEGFVLVGVERHTHPKAPNGFLEPFVVGHSRSDDADLIIGAYLSRVASDAHQELALQAINRLSQDNHE